jgi:hypothetical protein
VRLEHFADAGKLHRIDLENLNRDRGTLGRRCGIAMVVVALVVH